MDWVFLIIAVGLIGILVEMLLAYLKEANEITGKNVRPQKGLVAVSGALLVLHQHHQPLDCP